MAHPRPHRIGPAAIAAVVVAGALVPRLAGWSAEPGAATPPGGEKPATLQALELGATALQSTAPVDRLDVHLVGFHPMKDDPQHQMLAHHYCHQVNADFAQCVLFDGDGDGAHLNGIEYIISERLFEDLPAAERRYWHPHNYEILSGQLVAPGIPAPAEHALMADKMNSFGKTWHVWMSSPAGGPGDAMPLGPAHLAWSFNRDGEAKPGLVEERDRALGTDTQALRRARADLAARAHPQAGVDALAGAFPGAGGAPDGVRAKPDAR